jgi:CBS domain containing-hemolysin-like protein
MKLIYALLVVIVLKCIVLYKLYRSVPPLELKRRARQGDKRAAKLYKVAAYGPDWDLLLWLIGTSAAVTLFIWSARTNWWLAAAMIVLTICISLWAKFSVDGWAGSVEAFAAPAYAKLLSLLHPVLSRLAKLLPPGKTVHFHTGIYEQKDLLELLKKQNKQVDNRIPDSDLDIAANALTFGDKAVGQIMTPKRQVKLVGANETIGPMLMDELHKSGFSRFPVVKDSAKNATPEVIGTLYLNNLIGYEGSAKVKDLARHEVYFINESSNLRQALSAFLKTHHHLLIVVNSFEEMAGVLSLEDVLEQIIGKQIIDEFDSYENLRAVAAMDAKQEQTEHKEVEPAESPPKETVI